MLRLVGFPRRIARTLSITLILFPLAMAAAPSSLAQEFNARLTFMDGTAIDGRVVNLGEQACLVRVSNGDAQEFAVEDIARIAVLDEATLSPPPQIEVRCVDGSTLMAREATAQGGTLKLTGGSATVELESRNIDWVRLQALPGESQLAATWDEIVANRPTADILIVRRETDGEMRLNPVEGVLGDWDGEQVHFKFDESEIDVPVARVDSLVYYHPPGRRLSELRGVVTTQRGDRYQIRSWEPKVEGFQVTLQSGVSLDVPWELLDQIDFEAGRVQSLVDLEPTTLDWTPFLEPTGGAERLALLTTLFALERNQSFSGKPLTLFSASGFQGTGDRVRVYSRGLAMRSQTRIVYRLPDGFERLVGVLGIDPDVRPRGDVTVSIRGDGQVLWEGTLSGSDPEPTGIDVSVEGIARLTVEIGFGEGADLGDRVHWCEPRLIK
ncbi:MAG: NPCBM/NEW2 domain-containing protein [Planctomycetales bacterium]|nr:NPCBM/NEW2 domain-containing protein [Planctomycetales bacterium]